ncbi:hypothetical protein [Chryseobacterium sp. R2ACT005]|uniref:hypothetical protein n=1 Tax=Chryseobacterium sp. R2ACT005 TaxID=3416668 RepID=UPI003CF1A9B6
MNILFSIASFLMDIVSIAQKDKLINGLITDRKVKDSIIKDLMKSNTELMKHHISQKKISVRF